MQIETVEATKSDAYAELRKLATLIEDADRQSKRFRGDEFELRQYKVESRPSVILELLSTLSATQRELEEAWTLIGRCIPALAILNGNEQARELLRDCRNYALGVKG